MKVGDKVKCNTGSIDGGKHKGRVGRVVRFLQFTQYHPPECEVSFSDDWGDWGYFWKHDCEPAA